MMKEGRNLKRIGIYARMKMSLLLAALLITFAGTIQASEVCEGNAFSNCDLSGPSDFPENEEQLDEQCRIGIPALECVTKFEERCQTDSLVLEEFSAWLAIVKDLCNKDSFLNAVIVENLQCYKYVADDLDISRECDIELEDKGERQQYNQALIEAALEAFESNETLLCASVVYEVSCYALQIKNKCGNTAMEAFVDLGQRFIMTVVDCGGTIGEVLPEIFQSIVQEDELADIVGEALKKKK